MNSMEHAREHAGAAAQAPAEGEDAEEPVGNYVKTYNAGVMALDGGNLSGAEAAFAEVLEKKPDYGPALRQLASTLALQDRPEEAREAVAQVLRSMPSLTVEIVRTTVPFQRPEDHEHWLESLRRAGLPD